MSGRRGRPPGARPPSEEDLKTPKTGQFFQQQPFAPIFQQRMGGGASQGAGSHSTSQHDHVDLTGASGESCSEAVTSSSAQNDTPTAAEACNCLQQLLATYSDSEESDGAPSSQHPSSTAGPSHPTPDHETEGDCIEALRKAWTFRVREGLNSNKYVEVRLDDPVIRQLEMIKRKIHSRKKNTDTSFSAEDKTLIVHVLGKVNGMSIPSQYHAWHARTKCEILMMTREILMMTRFVDWQCMAPASSLSSKSFEKYTEGWTRKP